MKYQIRKIAVATNFSAEANNALDYAVTLAKKHEATLDIIHAVSPSDSRNKKAQFVGAAYEKLKMYKDDILAHHGIEARVFARVGDVTDFVYKYCSDNKTDLLIIGIQAHVKKYFGDSRAYELIKKIECPVLSIPLGFKKQHFEYVLFPVRDVEGVKDKLEYSKPFIQKDRSELHMICFDPENRDKAEEIIQMAKEYGIGSYDPNYEIFSPRNIPSRIIEKAREKDDDLIVINATSEKEWYNIFGENYTEYILKEADIAVLSITHDFQSHLEVQQN